MGRIKSQTRHGRLSAGRFFVVTVTRLRKLHAAAFLNLFLHPITAVSLRCFAMLMPGHKPHHGQRNFGFTLVELLVVIAILALLLSLILTALARARANASAVACCAHLRQIGVAFAVYASDNGGKLPDPGDTGVSWETSIRFCTSEVLR